MLFLGRINHLFVTVFQIPRHSRPFSFNPKNRVYITTDEVSDFFFVAEFVAKNVIFVTAATNRSCNILIIKYAYRVQKLPWKVHDILHREMINSAYLFDIQLIRLNIMFGDLRYSRRFTEFFGGF